MGVGGAALQESETLPVRGGRGEGTLETRPDRFRLSSEHLAAALYWLCALGCLG